VTSRRLVAICLLCAASLLQAQDQDPFDPDPAFEIDEAGGSWRPFGEMLLRGDRVTGLPGGRADLERVRFRGRIGAIREGEALSFGVAAEAAIGTGANKDSLINNDVEDVDGVGLDQAWLRWRAGDHLALQFGKAPLPLALSPLLWDDDLRPIGASVHLGGAARGFDRWHFDLGMFAPDPLAERGPRFAAAQVGWHWREGAPLSGGALLAYVDHQDLDDFARAGLGRGNSVVAGRYLFDYRILDLQLYLRKRVGEKSLEARIDLARNLDAPREDRGTRASLVYGDRFTQPGWEFGWAWQRMQRNAVLAAVTADDWWFHTAARGHMPWIGYGFDATWSLRLAAFFETRDGLDEATERLLLDLEARW
jgi:hypothetical protein